MRIKRGYGYGKAGPGLKMALEERLPSVSGGWLFQEREVGKDRRLEVCPKDGEPEAAPPEGTGEVTKAMLGT